MTAVDAGNWDPYVGGLSNKVLFFNYLFSLPWYINTIVTKGEQGVSRAGFIRSSQIALKK